MVISLGLVTVKKLVDAICAEFFVVSVLREDKISESIQTVLYKTIMKMVNSSYFFYTYTFFWHKYFDSYCYYFYFIWCQYFNINDWIWACRSRKLSVLTPGFFQICFLGKFRSWYNRIICHVYDIIASVFENGQSNF